MYIYIYIHAHETLSGTWTLVLAVYLSPSSNSIHEMVFGIPERVVGGAGRVCSFGFRA